MTGARFQPQTVLGHRNLVTTCLAKEFSGKEKLLALKDQPLTKRLVSLTLDVTDPTVTLWGNEPIFRDHKLVG